jgi:hypothetical protein
MVVIFFVFFLNMTDVADTEINDIRIEGEFKGITFSKFKKSDVRKELLNNLIQAKVEPSCYWSAELICSGHCNDLWELILFFYSKHIHLGNPRIAVYLELRMDNFKNIVNSGYNGNELRLRNNQKIRNLFCEIICVLCDAKRKHSFDDVKIKKEDFDMTRISHVLKAPTTEYAKDIFKSDDPKELFVAINELCYHLSDEIKNVIQACYWIEWIMEFEAVCKNKKTKMKCERRPMIPVESKCQMDIIWIIWEIFLEKAKAKMMLQKIMNALLKMFCLKYTNGCCRRRKYIMYFAVSLLCENICLNEEIIREEQKAQVANILNKINSIYKQIKKNEESPGTDYLFKNIKSSNLEKTIEKLEAIDTFGENFIPRISDT